MTFSIKKHVLHLPEIWTIQTQLVCGEDMHTGLQWRTKQFCNRVLRAFLSCGCLIRGGSHCRHTNWVNANEMWWKAQARHTSDDYCTINHPVVNAGAFLIRTPIRHPDLCSPSHKAWITQRMPKCHLATKHNASQRCQEAGALERKCFVGSIFFCLCECFNALSRSSDLFSNWGCWEGKVTPLTLAGVYSFQINCFPVQNPKSSCLISCVRPLLISVCWSTKPFVCVSNVAVVTLGLQNKICIQ